MQEFCILADVDQIEFPRYC